MTGAARAAGRAVLTVLCVTVLVVLGIGAVPEASAATTDPVTVTVTAISPYTPNRTDTLSPITFTLNLANTGSSDLSGLTVTAQRGDPIGSQSALGAVRTAPTSPGADDQAITATDPVKTSLVAGESTQVTFTTTTSMQQGAHPGICLCANQVYPIYFLVHRAGNGSDTVIGRGGTYLPVTFTAVDRLQVGWLWPLLDRPHRLLSDTVFSDDDLAAELVSGGRLDRALSVVEQVGPTVPVTLVVDPETIDEISVMAAGSYRVRTASGASVAGTGTEAAMAWLARLHAVFTDDPLVQVATTAYGDPDVQSVAGRRHSWSAALPTAMQARVRRALEGASVRTDLDWPAASRISASTLAALVAHGARQVVLSSSGLATDLGAGAVAPGAVSIRSGSTTVPVLVTTPRLSGLISDAVTRDASGPTVLPRLLAELAVRVTPDGDSDSGVAHQVALAPPRYVDPDVARSVEAIRATSTSVYTRPVVLSALGVVTDATVPATLRSGASTSGLPPVVFDTVRALSVSSPTITSLLIDTDSSPTRPSTAVRSLLASLPVAAQRLESSAFRSSDGQAPSAGTALAVQLSDLIDTLRNGVQLVQPSSGSYTLASGNSALPVTVVNKLDYPVYIDVKLSTVGGLPGLSSQDILSRQIAQRSKVILHIPASLDRSGTIKVQASMTSPSGGDLGSPITLSLHSSALGRVGIIIMVVAGVLLLLALGRRWHRSISARRSPRPVVVTSGELE